MARPSFYFLGYPALETDYSVIDQLWSSAADAKRQVAISRQIVKRSREAIAHADDLCRRTPRESRHDHLSARRPATG